MAHKSGSWEGKPVRAYLIRVAVFFLPLLFAIFVAWQLTNILPTPTTWPGKIFWWLIVVASSTMALRFADRFAKRLMPLAVLMKLSLVFPDKAPSRFGVSLKTGTAHSLEELIDRAEQAGRHDDLTEAAETILALAAALNAHDPRTRGHGDRVRAYVDMLGEEVGYTEEERNKLKWAAMLHDIGKLRVSAEIINSPGKLTDEEWTIMRNHPDWGMELAAPLLPWLGEFAAAIGQHHERFDGNGYPNGLAGEEIGLAARVTSVADTYDVMTSVRSYKEARPASEAREELARCAGSQFDPVVVRAFLNISLGRQRWVAGPLSWLAQVPFFQSALQGATTLAQNVAVVAQTGVAATAIGATAVVAPTLMESPDLAPEGGFPAIEVTANDDTLTLPEDQSEVISLLSNDGVEVRSVSIVSGPSHGTAVLGTGGTLTYTPDPEFSGTDEVTYQACGSDGVCDTAVLSISVTAVNDPPGLLDVPASLEEDSSTIVDVLSFVVDIDGDAAEATLTLSGVAGEGLILANGDGTFTYTPPPDFSGTDTFTVQICDQGGACALRTLSVTVGPINDEPTVEVVVPVVLEDTPASIFVDAADVDGDVLTTSIVVAPTSGSAIVDLDGSVSYVPDANFFGAESITIEVCDPTTCMTEDIIFNVAAVNDPPIVPGPGPLATPEDTMISFDPLAGASDPEGGAVTLASYDAVSANGGSIVEGKYTPAADFVGVDTFSYSVADPEGATSAVTVTVTVTAENDNPMAAADSYSVAEDGVLSVLVPGLLDNDSDPDGDALTVSLEALPADGVAVVNGDGSFTYTPDPDFYGSDSISYRLVDGAGGFDIGSVAVEVGPVNDAPIANDDAASASGPVAVVVTVLVNDLDLDGDFDPSSVSIVVAPTKGGAVANPDGTVNYTLTDGESGIDTFVYEICDTSALCDVATVTMSLLGPDAVDDSAAMVEDAAPITIDVVANDTDPDADLDPTSAVVHSAAGNGLATANGDGTFDYDSDPDFFGIDSFEYKVCDLMSACDTATVTITVTTVNDVPVANDDSGVGFTTLEDTPFTTVSVTANDTDAEDGSPDASTVVIVGATPPGLTNNGDGTFDYNPPLNTSGDVVFTYEVDDSAGATSNVATVTITVTTVNDVPSFTVGPNQSVLEDAGSQSVDAHATTISAGPANESGQSVSFNVSNDNPTLFESAPTIDSAGKLTYKAWNDKSGSATVTVSISDDGGIDNGGVDTSADQMFTIVVTGVNDEPNFNAGSDVTVNEDAGLHTIAAWATAVTAGAAEEEPPVQTLTFNILANDNPGLFTSGPSIDPATGDLTFDSVADAEGEANLDIDLTDDGGLANGGDDTSATRTFKITVDPVNDAPSFTKGPDQNPLPDSGAHSVVGWATSISPGPANESGQSVSFNTTGNTNPALFSTAPLIATTGTLVYTVAPAQFGSATITIEAEDNGGTANGGIDTSPSQTFDINVVKPTVVISEFRPDGPAGANDEFVEIFNADSVPINLAGWKLHITSGLDLDFYTFPSFTLNPGQHYLVAHPSVAPGLGADGVTSGVVYGPAWGDVQLLSSGAVLVDAFHYGSGPTAGDGTPAPAWVTTSIDGSFERRDGLAFGNCVDSQDSYSDFVRRHGMSTPQNSGAPVTPCSVPPSATNLVIAEFRTGGPLGFEDEFIEVFNPTGADVDISFWTLEMGGAVLHSYQSGTVVAAGTRYVVAAGSTYAGFKDDTYNGVIPSPWLTFFDGLLELKNGPAVVDAVAWGFSAAEGTPLPSYDSFDSFERSYDRGFNGCADIDANFADFVVSFAASPGTGIC